MTNLTVSMPEFAHHPTAGPPLHQIRRLYVALGLIVVALVLLGALILIRHDKTQGTTTGAETFTPAPGSLLASVAQIPASVSNAVGVASPTYRVTPPASTRGQTLWQAAGKSGVAHPVVFFYGAEFNPYSATERWPLVIALARFGTFNQLGLAQSSGTEVFPSISTFTFWHVDYTSRWITLRTVERYGSVNPTGSRYVSLEHPDRSEASAISAFDSPGTAFPLLDVANRYVLSGSIFTPAVLAGVSSSDVISDLAYPNGPVSQALLSAANEITAAICNTTGQQPTNVCSAHGVLAADQRMGITAAR